MSKQDPIVHELFEGKTGSWQYLVADSVTKHAVIIDPVLDFEPTGCIVSTKSADGILDVVKQNGYKVKMILETHAHADHLTAASYLKSQLTKIPGGNHEPLICVGSNIKQIQDTWGRRYGISACEYQDVFDKFLTDNEEFSVGALKAKALHLPGHTPDLMGYMIAGKPSYPSSSAKLVLTSIFDQIVSLWAILSSMPTSVPPVPTFLVVAQLTSSTPVGAFCHCLQTQKFTQDTITRLPGALVQSHI